MPHFSLKNCWYCFYVQADWQFVYILQVWIVDFENLHMEKVAGIDITKQF